MPIRTESTLEELAVTFAVRDVMTPAEDLVRSDRYEEAEPEFSEFDVIPFPATGDITGYFRRGIRQPARISVDLLLSDATSVIELPALLSSQEFYFVLWRKRVAGYVHYSSLNDPLVKLPFFVLFEALERSLWQQLEFRVEENRLHKVLGDRRAHEVTEKKRRVVRGNVDVGWAGLFAFADMLRLAVHYELVPMDDSKHRQMVKVRNSVAHSDRPLVKRHADVTVLQDTYQTVQSLLQAIGS